MGLIPGFFGTAIGMVILVVLIIQAIVWFFVPFMIWGTTRRLKLFMGYYLSKDGKGFDWWGDKIVSIRKWTPPREREPSPGLSRSG